MPSGAETIAFKSLDGRIVRSFGSDPEDVNIHRCCGKWQRTKKMSPKQAAQLRATGSILPNLPRWRLADGINLSQFQPFPHQLIPSDILASEWLGFAGFEGLSRTRALVSDEGGTGKTLSASIAVRWVCCQPSAEGAVIVLCPPLLKDHWVEHLRAVFDDDPDRVRALSSAQWFDPNLHRSDILVISKYSWSKHWDVISARLREDSSPLPLCVVVDEVHQGRTGFDGGDETMEGDITPDGQPIDIASLKWSIGETCRMASYAIGASATPININSSEIVDILQVLGSEQTDFKNIPADAEPPARWMNSLGKLSSWARKEADASSSCPPRLTESLAKLLRKGEWPKSHWAEFDQSQAEDLADWLSGPDVDITPDLALTICREMHPFGQHLCMTLREHLHPKTAEMFRTRWERSIRAKPSDALLEFYESVEHIDSKGRESLPGMGEKLSTTTRMICSHRMNPQSTVEESGPRQGQVRYSGEWTPGEGLGWGEVRGLEDQRTTELAALIEEDMACDKGKDGKRVTSRGCVIFTDWRGTVHWLKDREIGLPRTIQGVRLEVKQLTGGTDLREAKAMLGRCETASLSSGTYPVLICTAAGEVGLDMPWATLLVHWDLHPNPQRMEQRAWRLDRIVKPGENITGKFTIVHMILEGLPVFEALTETVNRRFDKACRSLGLAQRTYVPEGEPVKISPEGSENNSRLLSQDISHLNDFLRDKASSSWPGRRLRESERLRTATVLHMTGVIDDASPVIETGKIAVDDLWSEKIVFGNIPISKLRDLESIHPSLSSDLSPGLSPSPSTPRHCAWEAEDNQREGSKARRLVSARGGLGGLFRSVDPGAGGPDIPMVRLPSGILPEDCTVALNIGLSLRRELALDDSGLRLIGHSGESYDPSEEGHWDTIFAACKRLAVEGPDGVQSAPQGLGTDSLGEKSAESRRGVLERRNIQDSTHRDRIRAKIEESDEDKARMLEVTADQLDASIQDRAGLVDQIRSLGHEMHPVMALEVGL